MTDHLPSSGRTPTENGDHETHDAMRLLAAGIPLSLLLDLATAVDSRQLYAEERGAADWLQLRVA